VGGEGLREKQTSHEAGSPTWDLIPGLWKADRHITN